MQQFYQWFEELGEEDVEEAKYRCDDFLGYSNYVSDRIETLKAYRDYCDLILKEIDETTNFLQQLEDKYNLVAKKTGELHQACELLVQEQVMSSFSMHLRNRINWLVLQII